MDFVFKENIFLSWSQPSILPTTNIFVWWSCLKTCFHTACLHINYHMLKQKVFIFWLAWKEDIQCILSVKLSAPQIFLFDGQAWKHDFMQIVVTAIIKCLNKKYFLFRGPAWKCFFSPKSTANIFVWWSSLKTLFHGDYQLQQYILVVQASYIWVKIFFVSWFENIFQFILSGKQIWWSGLKMRFCGDYLLQQLFT